MEINFDLDLLAVCNDGLHNNLQWFTDTENFVKGV